MGWEVDVEFVEPRADYFVFVGPSASSMTKERRALECECLAAFETELDCISGPAPPVKVNVPASFNNNVRGARVFVSLSVPPFLPGASSRLPRLA
jgi:hypothetical protein